jgi:hypothetical protein
MPTLWFVGVIMMFYSFYVFLARHTSGYVRTVLCSLAVFGLLYLVRHFFHIVEYRFFLYFFIFLAGVVCCKARLFSSRHFGVFHVFVAALVLCASVIVFRSFHEGPIYDYGGVTEAFISQASVLEIFTVSAAVDTMMLAFVFITFTLAEKLTRYLNETVTRFLSFASFSSYGVYLFHRPILDVITRASSSLFPDHGCGRLVLVIVFGLPLIFALSYIAQASVNKIVERLPSWA